MKVYEVGEVCEIVGLCPRSVKKLIHDGHLIAFIASPNRNSQKPRYRILEADLMKFIESRKTGSKIPERQQRRGKLPPVPSYC